MTFYSRGFWISEHKKHKITIFLMVLIRSRANTSKKSNAKSKIQNNCLEPSESRQGIKWFWTPDKLWLLTTEISKSSTNLCTWEFLWHRRTTWVWRNSEESKLQIGASAAYTIYTIKKEEDPLLVFERKVLRTTYGPKTVDGVYSRVEWFYMRKFQKVNVEKPVVLKVAHDYNN
jgi:hypothetical protein